MSATNKRIMKGTDCKFYINKDGEKVPVTPGVAIFHDIVTNTLRSVKEYPTTDIWHKGVLGQTSKYILKECGIPTRQIKLSKYYNLLTSDTVVHFKEHSGVGMGGPKVYPKPPGAAFGIEVEFAFDGADSNQRIANKLNFCEWITNNYSGFITERDGSLDDVCANNSAITKYRDVCVELVSPPTDFPTLSRQIIEIFSHAVKMGAVVPNDGFGIHVTSSIYGRHIKKSAAKMIMTINSKKDNRFWLAASGRPTSFSLKKYAPFNTGMEYETCLTECHANHYRAGYVRNAVANAIELRIFKSTVDPREIQSILELTSHLARFSMSTKENWIEWLSIYATDGLREYLENNKANRFLLNNPELDEQ